MPASVNIRILYQGEHQAEDALMEESGGILPTSSKPLNIKDPEAYQLASELARLTGKPLTRVVVEALRHELARQRPRRVDMDKARATLARIHAMPIIDDRSAEEILGYDERGMFD
jgi:antitoxin VapB